MMEFWIFVGGVLYVVGIVLMFVFVHGTFKRYNNLKATLMGMFWPISLLVMLLGGLWFWLREPS